MACINGITAAITNDCDYLPVAGTEVDVIMINRTDIATVTYGTNKHVVEDIVLKVGKIGYKHTGFNKSIDGGSSAVVDEKMPNYFKQSFSFEAWGIDAATTKAIDNMNDIVVIVELKNKGNAGDGTFQVIGLETGLKVAKDDKTFNANMGKRLIGMESIDNSSKSSHIFYKTDYAVTKALVDSLLVEQD
jgi:hypothetical protein